MRKILAIIFFSMCMQNIVNAQNYSNYGDEAMNNGKYQEAVDYYSKAYVQNPTDELTKKINIAQNLKKEFDEIDKAIYAQNFVEAEIHINNVLMIDPSNKFIDNKRQQIKQKQAQNSRNKRQRRWNNFTDGFKGDDDFHDMLGGFHYRCGYSYVNMNSFGNSAENGYAFDIYYNNSKKLPLTFDIGLISSYDYQSFNFGIYSSYNFSRRFTFDYGGGYQTGDIWSLNRDLSNPYLKLGCTFMFEGEYGGGLNYSYVHGFDAQTPINTHNITYIFGRKPTGWITYTALIIGLIALGSVAG